MSGDAHLEPARRAGTGIDTSNTTPALRAAAVLAGLLVSLPPLAPHLDRQCLGSSARVYWTRPQIFAPCSRRQALLRTGRLSPTIRKTCAVAMWALVGVFHVADFFE